MSNPYRALPAVHDVLQSPTLAGADMGREFLVEAVRREIALLRDELGAGDGIDGHAEPDRVALRALERARRDSRPRLRRVVNATGIVLHTNLGRAPLAESAAVAAQAAGRGYLNLELDLDTGRRSSRQDAVREWLRRLTGAESATVVNNNAAGTILALRALCAGREVIVSRGQLVEIGGSFRIPEILEVSGAILHEVGTTNITRLADYERAVNPRTAAILRIHPSNFRVSGFTRTVDLADLVRLGREHSLKVIDDVGSGALVDFARFGLGGEPVVSASVAAGADLVLFSGDKLLGGPQAGILVGRRDWIAALEADPLMRALRPDKTTLAALEATLRLYLSDPDSVPVLHMLGLPLDRLDRRAEAMAERLRSIAGIDAEARRDVAFVGGGSLPDQSMPTSVVAVVVREITETELARRLRLGDPAILGRVQDGRLLLDVRTMFESDDEDVVAALEREAGDMTNHE